MTRINQNSSFVSATNTSQTSQTRETTRSVPIPASALEILKRAAGRAATGQTGFEAPVSAQRAQLNLSPEFETPAPRPSGATAPGQTAPPLSQSELTRAFTEAHRMVYGADPSGPAVQSWLDEARSLAEKNGNNFDAVKFALHKQLTDAKKGAPIVPGTGDLPQGELSRAVKEASQMFSTTPPGNWAARAQELAAQYKGNFEGLKFALHKEMLAAKEGRAATSPGQALPQSEVERAKNEALQMFSGAPPGDWAARAQELAAQYKDNFDGLKFALHKEMLAAKEGRVTTAPGKPLSQSELTRAFTEAHRMVYGADPSGPAVQSWLDEARSLAEKNGNDFDAVKFALHKQLTDAKKGAPIVPGTGDLPQGELSRAVKEASQMFSSPPPGNWAARAQELAAQYKGNFEGLKFALHKEMLAAKEGRVVTAPGQPLPQSEVLRALNEAHRMVFGGDAAGKNLGAWMARAQELAAQHGNDFDALKFALHKELTDLR